MAISIVFTIFIAGGGVSAAFAIPSPAGSQLAAATFRSTSNSTLGSLASIQRQEAAYKQHAVFPTTSTSSQDEQSVPVHTNPSTYTPSAVSTPTTTPTPTMTPLPTSTPAVTQVAASLAGTTINARLLAEAETQEGVPYVYGGDTPAGGFDCSGLIYWAAQQLGITSMPRDTYEMLSSGVSSGLLIQTSDPQPGDLAFFGTGHVELVTSTHDTTFGAQRPGTDVGFHTYYPPSYEPTEYFIVT